jgi:two-component system response regulator AtoC
MPPSLQVKLLRVLQDGEVRRVGDNRMRAVDVRVISATNKDLQEEIRKEQFRNDLYYRIAVVPIHLAPLRQRQEEIPLLARHFVQSFNRKLGLATEGIDPEAMRLLLEYSWPGNVRELENTIERAIVLAEGPKIMPDDLLAQIQTPVRALDEPALSDDNLSVKKHGAALERRLIQRALERTRGNKTKAAELLELSSRALLYKIREYGLD